jgi:hypothetical protein
MSEGRASGLPSAAESADTDESEPPPTSDAASVGPVEVLGSLPHAVTKSNAINRAERPANGDWRVILGIVIPDSELFD